ncbi:hypothetical protein [Acetobacter fabarum]|jgi:hypothetical protein|uniref:Uncharacterized protein n=1 Tax=Acetobacter fabarum TaxID=483199 RepID=A0A269XWI8_9PROT|nr:hypothetical protein [Acetobacter fabarum]PAK77648.1 hypothetical protein B8X00_09930 [Acetobacter fabarum]PEN23276.1 hypothetical protein CRM93_12240 [Acetobacter fabarum]
MPFRYIFNIPAGSLVQISGAPLMPPRTEDAVDYLVETAAIAESRLKRPKRGYTVWEIITASSDQDMRVHLRLPELKSYLLKKLVMPERPDHG